MLTISTVLIDDANKSTTQGFKHPELIPNGYYVVNYNDTMDGQLGSQVVNSFSVLFDNDDAAVGVFNYADMKWV